MWWTELSVQRSLHSHLAQGQIWDVCHHKLFLVAMFSIVFVRRFRGFPSLNKICNGLFGKCHNVVPEPVSSFSAETTGIEPEHVTC